WAALFVVLLCGFDAVELLRNGAVFRDECGGGEPTDHHASVFSPADFATFQRALRPGGFCDCVRGAGRNGCLVWNAAGGAGIVIAISAVARRGDGTRSRPVAVGAKRAVSRRAICNALSDAILAAGFAGGVSKQPGSGEMAMGVRPEPDGGSD